MTDRKIPYPAGYPLPAFYKNQNLEYLAITHEENRQRVITEILMDLFLVAVKGYIKKGQPIHTVEEITELKGAEWQSWKSTGGNEAAHCAPRQLYIGSARFDRFLEAHVPDRASAAIILFADADDLPANFNKADSLAESKGLAEGFRKACVSVINNAQQQGEFEENSLILNVKAAFQLYRAYAIDAFLQSKVHLEDVLRFKTKDASAVARRKERLQIIKFYQSALNESHGHQEKMNLQTAKSLIRIYSI